MEPARPGRMPWIDHLRLLVIVLVVHMHACVTYSHVGDWYVKSAQEPTLVAKIPFIVWQGHLQSFFMGLLFFISGYFAHHSLTRRGSGPFLRERFFRLGLPALFYMLVVHPFILLVLNPWNANFGRPAEFYARYVGSGRFLASSGPLWFAVALLLFCAALAAWHAAHRGRGRRRVEMPTSTPGAAPSVRAVGWFALGSFALRLVQPIGTSVLNLQLCFFVQYVAFFVAGLHAARHGWLPALVTSRQARVAGSWALLGGPVVLLALIVVGGRAGPPEHFFGGSHWQALGFALWEQLAGVGLSLGLLAWGARAFDRDEPWLRWCVDRSFAVYVLHAPVLVALTMLFRALPQNMYLLAGLLTVAGLAASFLVADLARRIPGLRAIL